jgi:pilus assembly protein Flp/PilA
MAGNLYQLLGNFTWEKKMKKHLLRLWKEEEGQDLTEYALLLVLIALAAVTVMGTLGNAINNVFSSGSSTLTSAT